MSQRKENIIGIQEEVRDPTLPPRQMITQEIKRPEEMALITTHDRLMWRINSIVSKIMHELFLSISASDVVTITGKQSDASAFEAVSALFAQAGWFSLWIRHERPEDSIVLLVAQTPQVVIDCFEKELKLDRADFIRRGWIPNPEAPRAGSENTGPESNGETTSVDNATATSRSPERN